MPLISNEVYLIKNKNANGSFLASRCVRISFFSASLLVEDIVPYYPKPLYEKTF